MSAMELPELRGHLAKFLDRPEIAAAARVCKSWRETFTALLYREIVWTDYTKCPSSQSFATNAAHVRSLIIHFAEPVDCPFEACTELESVSLCFRVQNPETWTRLGSLIRHNPDLKKLVVRTFENDNHIHGFMEALASSCPRLQKLEAFLNGLDAECTKLLLDASVRVESLDLCDINLRPPETMDQWPVFPHLKRLRISLRTGLTAGQQLDVIRKSPRLESLVWYLSQGVGSVTSLPDIIAAHCPHLKDLVLADGEVSSLRVSEILESCRRLSSLTLVGFEFDARAPMALSRHFSHLTHLEITHCPHSSSAMVQQVLASCPKLDHLTANKLDVRDVLGVAVVTDGPNGDQQETYHPHEWACTNLRFLSVNICGLEGKPEEWQRTMLRQLSKLRKLEVLRMQGWSPTSELSRDGLDLRLQSGLGILSSLNIRELDFDGLWQEMDEDDVRWMVDAWPKLSHVAGRLHPTLPRVRELQGILTERGVRVRSYLL